METDQALMQRWQRGDTAAFEALVRRWEAPVTRFLARYGGRADQAADQAQEVFLRVYRAGPTYQPRAAFSTWLFQIALNIARDSARRRRVTAPLDGCDAVDDADPSAAAAAHEMAAVVDRALAELPEPLRVVLVLRHYQGMSFEEMGRVLRHAGEHVEIAFHRGARTAARDARALKPDLEETEP